MNKYFCEMTEGEKKEKNYTFDKECVEFIMIQIGENMFKLHSKFEPTGDQPEAIKQLVNGIQNGEKYQTLLEVTGSRKNFYYGKYNTKS